MSQVLDLAKLRDTPINNDFYPYCQIDGFIKKEILSNVLEDFPKITVRGSLPANRLKYGTAFQHLLDALYSTELRDLVAEKFAIDLSQSATLLTVRGKTELRDGHIHTDTPSKLMTLLLYLNEEWTENTGNLRLLRDGSDLENYFDEVIPTAGKLLVFKVTDNCWHGHYPFIGSRKTIQLNYVTSQKIVDRELKKHSRSYTFKKLVNLVG